MLTVGLIALYVPVGACQPALIEFMHQYRKLTVQMQGFNRRSSTHGMSDDLRAIRTPSEMALPLLAVRVEEAYEHLPCMD